MDKISSVANEFYDVVDNQILENLRDEKLAKMSTPTDDTVVSRKQSASDLQSRLKTRKLLGVGELAGDNGDVYKSKISQLLGINESLYLRMPRGFFVWNTVNSFYFFLLGAMYLFFPKLGVYYDHGIETIPNDLLVVVRYYGVALVSFGILFKFILQQRETRADIALLLLVNAVFHIIILIVTAASHESMTWWSGTTRVVLIFGNIFYHAAVDGQGGLHRQLIRVIEESSLLSSSPTMAKKPLTGLVEDLINEYETVKKTN